MKCIGCGICCIVCTDIQLTQKEKKDARYDTKKRNGKGNLNGYSNMVLRRRLVYINELKNDIYACVYFDPKKEDALFMRTGRLYAEIMIVIRRMVVHIYLKYGKK